MLYPIQHETATGFPTLINPGHLVVIPWTLSSETILEISVVHTAPKEFQDYSIRVWLSQYPGSNSLFYIPSNMIVWHPNKIGTDPVVVYDENLPDPDFFAMGSLSPGNYWINILNLVNTENSFSCVLTVLS